MVKSLLKASGSATHSCPNEKKKKKKKKKKNMREGPGATNAYSVLLRNHCFQGAS